MALTFIVPVSPWTVGKVEQLKALAAEALSASAIADALGSGISRNSVIGKCRRLGIPLLGPTNPNPPKARKIKPDLPRVRLLTFRERKPPTFRSPPIAFIPTCEPVTFMDLAPHHCRYITQGEGITAMFCGADKTAGSYCQHHHNECHAGKIPLGPAESEIRRRLMARQMRAA